jgi:hypothetical protein
MLSTSQDDFPGEQSPQESRNLQNAMLHNCSVQQDNPRCMLRRNPGSTTAHDDVDIAS